jgi:PAS domain S-box-containing protein
MSSAPSLAQVRDVFEALGPPGTPFTTPEVATKFDCTNRTIYNRLETLVEDDVLETKKVGARGRVWWHPVEKHNAERGNEQRLGALVKATMEGVYRVSPDWSEIYQLAGEGFLAEDLPNTWQEYIPNADQERVGQAIEEAIKTRSPFELEHQIKRADGTVGWAHSRAVPILEEGDIVEWFGTATDITERKEREAELERHEVYLKSVSDLITVVDENGTIQYDSPSITETLGYDRDERVGESAFAHIHPEDREGISERFQSRVAGMGVPQSVEYRTRTKDGTWVWAESRAHVSSDTSPIEGVVITTRDITERKEQERKRQEVIDRVTDGIIEVDADWRCTFINGKGGELADTSEAKLLDRNLWEVFEDARGTTFEKQYREVMDTREPASFVEYYPTLDSWFDVQAYPNDDDGIAIYFRDITERKEREQARQRAEKRYQKLLELAPVPIVAVDPRTGELLEANEAAGDLIGCPTAELIGRTRVSLHPSEKSDGYDAIFRNAREQGGSWRRLPDGSPTCIVTEHGEKTPVEITSKKVTLQGEDIIYEVLQDISDQLEYQHWVDTLNEATHELFNAETAREVTRAGVEVLAEILDISAVAFYSFDEDALELKPTAHTTSGGAVEVIDELPVFEPGVGVEWHAFADGQTAIVDDFRTRRTDYEFDRSARSELVVPVADRGVLLVSDTRPDMFNDWTTSLVETLGATIEAALDHTERKQDLQTQRRELQDIESLNQQIRGISHAIVQADTRAELEETVCERLIVSDSIEFAWIGRVDLETKTVTPRAQAGVEEGYLDSVSLSLDGDNDPEPSVEAVRSRDICSSPNTATGIQGSGWRSAAIERGFRSVESIPLIYRKTFYGVLTVYGRDTSSFPNALQSVLGDLSDLVAHAAFAMEQRAVMQTEQTMELKFEIRDQDYLFCRLAAVLDCGLKLEGIVPQPDESPLAFVSVADRVPTRLLQETKQLDGVRNANLITRADDTLLKLQLTEPCLGSVVSDRGMLLRGLWAENGQCRLTVEVPKTADARRAVNLILSQYEGTQLLAKQESRTSSSSNKSINGGVLEALTPRQREVMETAYRFGYFDSPRRANGDDIAELFGFSNAAFHQHLRKAERTLFEELLEGVNSSLTAEGAVSSEPK